MSGEQVRYERGTSDVRARYEWCTSEVQVMYERGTSDVGLSEIRARYEWGTSEARLTNEQGTTKVEDELRVRYERDTTDWRTNERGTTEKRRNERVTSEIPALTNEREMSMRNGRGTTEKRTSEICLRYELGTSEERARYDWETRTIRGTNNKRGANEVQMLNEQGTREKQGMNEQGTKVKWARYELGEVRAKLRKAGPSRHILNRTKKEIFQLSWLLSTHHHHEIEELWSWSSRISQGVVVGGE